MSEEASRITEEELNSLRELEGLYQSLTREYGELKYQQMQIKQRTETIELDFLSLDQQKTALLDSLTEKYGADIVIDINTGNFVSEGTD